MRLYRLNETTGEYMIANKTDLLAASQRLASLQHRKPVISNASAFIQYLRLQMENLPTEQLRVIYLDNANRILGDQVLSEGVEDQTAVYPRKIMQEALKRNATGIIVTHNHPAGQPRPTDTDLVITKALHKACKTLDIRFLDHLIIAADGGSGYFSFREEGLI